MKYRFILALAAVSAISANAQAFDPTLQYRPTGQLEAACMALASRTAIDPTKCREVLQPVLHEAYRGMLDYEDRLCWYRGAAYSEGAVIDDYICVGDTQNPGGGSGPVRWTEM